MKLHNQSYVSKTAINFKSLFSLFLLGLFFVSLNGFSFHNNFGATTTNLSTSSSDVISGPSCVMPGKTYTFTVHPDSAVSNVNWWVNGDASVRIDSNDMRVAYITFSPYNASTVSIAAGIHYSSSPWYEGLAQIIQFGSCPPAEDDSVIVLATEIATQAASHMGIEGPFCVMPGETYSFTAHPDSVDITNIIWWVNGDASIYVDPNNQRVAHVTFSPYNASTVSIAAGVNYSASPWYEGLTQNLEFGSCPQIVDDSVVTEAIENAVQPASHIGIDGPSCIMPGLTYTFTAHPDSAVTNINWWVNGDASIRVDSNEIRIAYVTFSTYNASTVSIAAGVNYSASPWYEDLTQNLEFGSCPFTPDTLDETIRIISYPEPFEEQTTVLLSNGEKILSAKILDLNGTVVIERKAINSEKVSIGEAIKSGVYFLHVVTEKSHYTKTVIKY